MAVLLIGYDVERQEPKGWQETKTFLKIASKLHNELKQRCTMFVCGKTLENNRSEFEWVYKEVNGLIDFEQHTYSHVLLKTVCRDLDSTFSGKVIKVPKGMSIVRGGNLQQIREEVEETNRLLKDILGIDCIGMTCPYGYYRGLCDRPDILEILHSLGIRFISSYARNEKDWFPLRLDVQPFWYEAQGFRDILEIPIQGWVDCVIRDYLGWENKEEYFNYVRNNLDYIAEHNLVLGYLQHDWSSIREDREMTITRQIIEYAVKKGIKIFTYRQYYEKSRSIKFN